MEKVINSYETLFITDVANGEEATKATVNKFTTLIADNAQIVEVAEWGKRRLAYLIDDKAEGYYTVVTFKSEPSFPRELERLLNIDEAIMRSKTLRLEFEPVAKAAVQEEEPVAEAPVAAEEAAPVAAEEAAPEASDETVSE